MSDGRESNENCKSTEYLKNVYILYTLSDIHYLMIIRDRCVHTAYQLGLSSASFFHVDICDVIKQNQSEVGNIDFEI